MDADGGPATFYRAASVELNGTNRGRSERKEWFDRRAVEAVWLFESMRYTGPGPGHSESAPASVWRRSDKGFQVFLNNHLPFALHSSTAGYCWEGDNGDERKEGGKVHANPPGGEHTLGLTRDE